VLGYLHEALSAYREALPAPKLVPAE